MVFTISLVTCRKSPKSPQHYQCLATLPPGKTVVCCLHRLLINFRMGSNHLSPLCKCCALLQFHSDNKNFEKWHHWGVRNLRGDLFLLRCDISVIYILCHLQSFIFSATSTVPSQSPGSTHQWTMKCSSCFLCHWLLCHCNMCLFRYKDVQEIYNKPRGIILSKNRRRNLIVFNGFHLAGSFMGWL